MELLCVFLFFLPFYFLEKGEGEVIIFLKKGKRERKKREKGKKANKGKREKGKRGEREKKGGKKGKKKGGKKGKKKEKKDCLKSVSISGHKLWRGPNENKLVALGGGGGVVENDGSWRLAGAQDHTPTEH